MALMADAFAERRFQERGIHDVRESADSCRRVLRMLLTWPVTSLAADPVAPEHGGQVVILATLHRCGLVRVAIETSRTSRAFEMRVIDAKAGSQAPKSIAGIPAH